MDKNCLIEKYRPTKIEDIIAHDDIINIFKNILKTGEMPHLLLYGSPGVGKTSTIIALCNELYGSRYKENVLELNASDDRGINIVREKIIVFSKFKLGTKDKKFPSPDFKIIILDEADAMTNEAQTALRKVMEDMTKITRFCFICNNISKIIDPIISRCVKLKFKAIDKNKSLDKLYNISKFENIKVKKNVIKEIINISDGDLRKSILLLQNLKYINHPIDSINIYDIYKYITIDKFKLYIDKLLVNNNIQNLLAITQELFDCGYIFLSIIKASIEFIVSSNVDDNIKSNFIFKMGDMECKIYEGCDEYLNLLYMMNYIKEIYI